MGAATTFSANASDVNPWTDCGIGAMVFGDVKVAAAISSITWDLGTTAVTSKMSSEESCNAADPVVLSFVAEKFGTLEEEIAIGEGENLVAVFGLYGCSSTEQTGAISTLRSSYSESLNATDDEAYRAQGIYNQINSAATQNCAS